MSEDKYLRSIPFSYQIVIVVGFIVIFYQLFSLSTSIYNETSVDRYNNDQQEEIAHLQTSITRKKNLYLARNFASFYRKKGKAMDLLNPGEKEIIINAYDVDKLFVDNNVEAEHTLHSVDTIDPFVDNMPPHKQWLYYFFKIQ